MSLARIPVIIRQQAAQEFEVQSRRSAIAGIAAAGAVAAIGYAVSRPSYADAVAKSRAPVRSGDVPTTEFLVHNAAQAANSHNTQPWVFRPRAGGIDILPDLSRATPVVDPDNHHLYASLGCAAENLRLAAGALGQSAEVGFASGHVSVNLAPNGTLDPLFAAIAARQCTRSDYDGSAVSTADLNALAAAATVSGTSLFLLTDTTRLAPVTDLIVEGARKQSADPAFVAELHHWLRFSTSSAIRTGDGLYIACSGNPVLPDWLGGLLFSQFFTPDAEADRAARQIASSSGLAVIVSERNEPAHWISAGRCYQRLALQATALGLKHAFVNQAVEVAATRTALAAELGLGEARPSLVLRFGRGPEMPKSLRRPTADVIS